MVKLRDLIDQPAVTVERHEPLARVAKTMYERHIGSVIVVDADGSLRGIFTERDLLRACAAGVDSHASTVGNWMTEDPVTAAADDDADDALRVMIERDFRHLPVIGEGGVTGVVSMRALSRALQDSPSG